jgi:signal transduction histidine kinase
MSDPLQERADTDDDGLARDWAHGTVHDLRGAVGSIANWVHVLARDGALLPKALASIQRSLDAMLELAEDLHDVESYRSGAEGSPGGVDLRVVLLAAQELVQLQAREKSVALDIAGGAAAVHPRAQRDRLVRAVARLLREAVQLAPAGGRVTARLVPDEAAWCLEIAPAEPTMGRSRKLLWVLQVAEHHGGTFEIASTPDGNRFVLRLPR